MRHAPAGQSAEAFDRHLAAHFAEAIGRWFTHPSFSLSEDGCLEFMARQRWLGVIYAAAPSRNANHRIRMTRGLEDDGLTNQLNHPSMLKLDMLCIAESDLAAAQRGLARRAMHAASATPAGGASLAGQPVRRVLAGLLASLCVAFGAAC